MSWLHSFKPGLRYKYKKIELRLPQIRTMNNEPECGVRRRRSSANPNLPLNLEVGFQVTEGGPTQGTPSPGHFKMVNSDGKEGPSSALLEFRKKQQSFDIQVFLPFILFIFIRMVIGCHHYL